MLCLHPFLFFDLKCDLSVLSRRMRALLSLRGCDFSSRLLRCRLLIEGLFSFSFLRVCRSSRALPQELLYLRLSSASLMRVVSSTIWWRLAFLLIECLLSRDSRSCLLLVESSESRLRLGYGQWLSAESILRACFAWVSGASEECGRLRAESG